MARSYFSKGCRGGIVIRLQQALEAKGFAPAVLARFADGDFGDKTVGAVRALQESERLPVTGEVDAGTWERTLRTPLPTLFERALQLTADFEGHGFGLAQGNFDGAGITWGIIGFTLAGGELQRVMHAIDERAPGTVNAAFDELAAHWRDVLAMPREQQIGWADGISVGPGKTRLPSAWVLAFGRLGSLRVAQDVQMEFARDKYFVPALESARRMNLSTERGIALCFDTHVQSGGVRDVVLELARHTPQGATESDRLPRIASVIAQAVTKAKYRPDVLARRMCIASGGGPVHGANYRLNAWGIGLFPGN